MIIGVDPHKLSHTATAIEPGTNTVKCTLRIDSSFADYRRLLLWGRQFDDRKWAVENARGLGRHLSQWLIARGEVVIDVPSTATARVRELSRGGRRKNDVIDAAAAACVAALQADPVLIVADDHTTVCAMLEERRSNVVGQRVRVANQLHAMLRELIPGGVAKSITARSASDALSSVRTVGSVERTRKSLARDLVRELKAIDASLDSIQKQMSEALAESGSRLEFIDGVGPVLAVRLIGRTGHASRFPSPHAFAAYTGTAPVEVASGEVSRHRLCRSGDRQLNSAIHLVAVTQARMKNSLGRAYYEKKIAEGKTRNDAIRCLKRQLAAHIWKVMLADERRTSTMRHQSKFAA